MSIAAGGLRATLFLFLTGSCVAKLWSGHQPHYAISEGVFVAATIAELSLAFGLLIPRLRTFAAIGVGAMAAIGIAIASIGHGKECGCLGSIVVMTAAQHVLLSSSVGTLAVLVWLCESRSAHK